MHIYSIYILYIYIYIYIYIYSIYILYICIGMGPQTYIYHVHTEGVIKFVTYLQSPLFLKNRSIFYFCGCGGLRHKVGHFLLTS